MISEFMCITPACNNMATEIDYRVDPIKNNNGKYPCYCICCMKGHTLLRTEYSNCFTQVECFVSSCNYEERIEDAIGRKEITPNTSLLYKVLDVIELFECNDLTDYEAFDQMKSLIKGCKEVGKL